MQPGAQIQFEVRTPVPDDGLIANVRHALDLGLPEMRDFEYPFRAPLRVIANGPSARNAPLDGSTLAINGALGLFTRAGLTPTYWAACDPQECVLDYLGEIPRDTTYLVASKCHPKVFERLQGRNVILWHVDDTATRPMLEGHFPVSRAVSITIVAFELMARLGWRDFHTWGWDGCVMDGRENAVEQSNGSPGVTVQVDDKSFPTTHTWALEAQDAVAALRGFPFPIHIHGGGMTGEILKAYRPGRIVTDLA